MFVNCTNHPYEIWSETQRAAAKVFGEVVDIGFLPVQPEMTPEDIRKSVTEWAEKIESMNPDAVLVAGEFSSVFMLVDKLLSDGVNVICSCAKRQTREWKLPDGLSAKESIFVFEHFRKYAYYGDETFEQAADE